MIDLKKLKELGLHQSGRKLWIQAEDVVLLIDQLESAQRDAARLIFACEFDGYTTVDKDRYDYAIECAEEAGREEPNAEDELNGLRRLIDAAMTNT